VIAGALISIFTGLGENEKRLEFACVNYGDRGGDFAFQVPRLIGQDELVSSKFQQIRTAGLDLLLVDWFVQEIGRSRFKGGVADASILEYGDHYNRNVSVIGQRSQATCQFDAVERSH
jgi:hypothetical protein